MGNVLKKVEGWPFTFGGEEHTGWLPPNAAKPLPTPVEHEVLDIQIQKTVGGYLLIWAARLSQTCRELLPPKIGDTWHDTLRDAEESAYEAFGIRHENWIDVQEPDDFQAV